MTSLDALQARAWRVIRLPSISNSEPAKTILRKWPFSVEVAGDDDLAARMALAAAIVAEGHDLIGLLRDAREELVHWEDTTGLLARVDAVLAAVDGPQ